MTKEGGRKWYHSNRWKLWLCIQSPMFFRYTERDTLKLQIAKERVSAFKAKKGGVCFEGAYRHWISTDMCLKRAIGMDLNANLPPVSTTVVASCHRCQRHQWWICQIWEQYQTAYTLKWTWRKKFILMLSLLPTGVQTKQLKHVWLKIFSICHGGAPWAENISVNVLKNSKQLNMLDTQGFGGKLIHEKNLNPEISWHCPIKFTLEKCAEKVVIVLFHRGLKRELN